ncbi:MAG: hypothetical protein FIB01_07335 [Gemmatimonadetes bacterium]|nr:hypothetical protein [Gemmatimonadota bacterium]
MRGAIAETRLPADGAEYLFAVMVRSFSPNICLTGANPRHWQVSLDECLTVWRTCETALGELPFDRDAEPAESGRAAA